MILDHLTSQPRNKRDLAERTGWTTRDVELAVQAARLEGAAICSNSDGYWLSSDPAEVRRCALALRRRLVHQALTARALLRTSRRMEARTALTLWSDAA